MPELVLVLVVHTPEDIGNPARPTLAEHELHARVALQRAREDDTRQELGTGELEQGESGRAPLGGILLSHPLIGGLAHGVAGGVEGDGDLALLGRGPQGVPIAMPDRLYRGGDGKVGAFEAERAARRSSAAARAGASLGIQARAT